MTLQRSWPDVMGLKRLLKEVDISPLPVILDESRPQISVAWTSALLINPVTLKPGSTFSTRLKHRSSLCMFSADTVPNGRDACSCMVWTAEVAMAQNYMVYGFLRNTITLQSMLQCSTRA